MPQTPTVSLSLTNPNKPLSQEMQAALEELATAILSDLHARWQLPRETMALVDRVRTLREEELDTQDTIDRSYIDPHWPMRNCDNEACGKPYRGPAVYCSHECAIADAGHYHAE